jgi:hypothetical protein
MADSARIVADSDLCRPFACSTRLAKKPPSPVKEGWAVIHWHHANADVQCSLVPEDSAALFGSEV